MGELRGRIIDRGEGSGENRKVFEALVDSDILERIRKGHWRKVEETVKQLAGVAVDLSAIRREAASRPFGRLRMAKPQAARQEAKRKGAGGQGPGSRGK